jgi:hypothetical protein
MKFDLWSVILKLLKKKNILKLIQNQQIYKQNKVETKTGKSKSKCQISRFWEPKKLTK